MERTHFAILFLYLPIVQGMMMLGSKEQRKKGINLSRFPFEVSENPGPFTQAERKQRLQDISDCSDKIRLNNKHLGTKIKTVILIFNEK